MKFSNILILPKRKITIEELYSKILQTLSDASNYDIEWDFKYLSRPFHYESFFRSVDHLIKYADKSYRNLGALNIIKEKDYLTVQFIPPQYGISSSDKHISFLYIEFIKYLKKNFKEDILSVFILDHPPVFLNPPTYNSTYIHTFISRSKNPKDVGRDVYIELTSPTFFYREEGYEKKIEMEIRPAYDNIHIFFHAKHRGIEIEEEKLNLATRVYGYLRRRFGSCFEGRMVFGL